MASNRLLFLWLLLIESSFFQKSQSTNAADFSFGSKASHIKNRECDKIIPGANRMAHGIDVTKLDLFPENTLFDYGFRKVFVEFTCNSKKHWTHPLIEDVNFDWPDQFIGVESLQAGSLTLVNSFVNNLQDYKNSFGAMVGFEIAQPEYGAFSVSGGYQKTQEHLLVQNKSIAEMSGIVSSVTVELHAPSGIKLHPDFAYYFKDPSPPKYEQSPERYDEFVQNYGTHYFESAIFGGYLHLKTVIEQNYSQNKSKEEISVTLGYTFHEIFNVSIPIKHITEEEKQIFTKNSQRESSYFGGKANIQPSNSKHSQIVQYENSDQPAVHESVKSYKDAGGDDFFHDWMPSINRHPWLMSGRLKPIENLVSNENFKSELAKATKVHRLKAFIADVKQTAESSKRKLSERNMKLIERIENAFCMGDSNELEKIISIIDINFVSVQLNDDVKFADYIVQVFRNDIIEGVFKLQIQLAQKCTTSERVDQLKTPMDESIAKYNEYEKNKNNSEKRNNFIETAERIITSFAEHMQGVCDHLLNGAPIYKWEECTNCVLDEFNTLGNTKYPALDWMIKHPKHP